MVPGRAPTPNDSGPDPRTGMLDEQDSSTFKWAPKESIVEDRRRLSRLLAANVDASGCFLALRAALIGLAMAKDDAQFFDDLAAVKGIVRSLLEERGRIPRNAWARLYLPAMDAFMARAGIYDLDSVRDLAGSGRAVQPVTQQPFRDQGGPR
jgi:hypothetical protein